MKSRWLISDYLGLPALAWLCFFFVGPMVYLLALSFAQKGIYGGVDWDLSLENYERTLDAIYLVIFSQSLWLATITTALCLIIAVPLAWAMVTSSARARGWWITILAVPFLMNLICRIYALKTLVSFDGPVASFARLFWPEVDPLIFSQNQIMVLYGMIATYLPFMVFPIYVALEKFDFQQFEAVLDLGGSAWTGLFRVILPQLKTAISSGIIMVFVPALGEFVIPDLLGGARVMLSGNLITEQFLRTRDWPFGAALAVELILFMSVFVWALSRWGLKKRGIV